MQIAIASHTGICSKINGGDHLRQGGPSMAAIDDPAGPPIAIKSTLDGPARLAVEGTACGMIGIQGVHFYVCFK